MSKRIIQGREVGEAEVDAWVAEAEAGYDVEELRKRVAGGRPGRGAEPSQVIPVRLTAEELAAVMERAEREHLNRSEAIRAALAEWSRAA
ncbi:ribbon-helix-helix protein, CopG family [Gulosibacter sp. 10]|uniref:ribbon-helix-helix protein, CopG family n=1 Tax=Gulosibacter sp. 10 TaxID=1255570 RepID=UPI000B34B69E|nr:ribbon-helix-helix protein, CopG family [Gulosibacter sp. 10]